MGEGGDRGHAFVGVIDILVLQLPSMRMRNKDRAESGFERRVYVRSGAVADHEGARGIEIGLRDEQAVVLRVLFSGYADAIEERTQAGSIELAQLFAGIALGE